MYHENENPSLHSRVAESIEKARGYLREDGGDVILVDISEDLVVSVQLIGSCANCNLSKMTLAGIEASVKREVPEVKKVVQVDYHN